MSENVSLTLRHPVSIGQDIGKCSSGRRYGERGGCSLTFILGGLGLSHPHSLAPRPVKGIHRASLRKAVTDRPEPKRNQKGCKPPIFGH